MPSSSTTKLSRNSPRSTIFNSASRKMMSGAAARDARIGVVGGEVIGSDQRLIGPSQIISGTLSRRITDSRCYYSDLLDLFICTVGLPIPGDQLDRRQPRVAVRGRQRRQMSSLLKAFAHLVQWRI